MRLAAPVAIENESGGHSVQKEEPVMYWYDPTVQEAHVLRPDVMKTPIKSIGERASYVIDVRVFQ